MLRTRKSIVALTLSLAAALAAVAGDERPPAVPGAPGWAGEAMSALEAELVSQHGEGQRGRIRQGLSQVARCWRTQDGDRDAFAAFVRRCFAGDPVTREAVLARFERQLEQLDGHMNEIRLEFRRQVDEDRGPILPLDEVLAGYDPSAHIDDDFFENKLAFMVLLNFPLTTLDQRLAEGESWTRRQWAEARLAQRFSKRIPAEVQLAVAQAAARAGQYIAQYNIWVHHLVGAGGRLFPPGLRLLCHWNLRDEIKACYSDPESGLAKQRTIQKVMERIVDQTIPGMVIDNPHVDWNPFTNEVTAAAVEDWSTPPPGDRRIDGGREPDTRYEVLLNNFRAQREVDPYSPTAPTLIARRFEENREIPERRVKKMFEMILASPLLGQVAGLIESRLGRPLEPFDIWYNGFRPRGAHQESELDRIVAERYPTAAAYQQDLPNLLEQLGFAKARAAELASAIAVDPARGSGHAWGPAMRGAKAHLRTRVGSGGMDYKGFNIAVHELGHNVEQTISIRDIDHTLLAGVPNTAFTEALAFVFQARDLELLGLAPPDSSSRGLEALGDFWAAAEISAVALVDMDVWHWMYDHPGASPAELRDATMSIARGIWNEYYASLLGERDSLLLGIYSHMISRNLYLPDYPVGHFIATQIEEQMAKAGDLGAEFDRMARLGNVAPDLWMKNATGATVGPEALLAATERALLALGVAPDDGGRPSGSR